MTCDKRVNEKTYTPYRLHTSWISKRKYIMCWGHTYKLLPEELVGIGNSLQSCYLKMKLLTPKRDNQGVNNNSE